VPLDACDEEAWDAVHQLRVKRMPDVFGDDVEPQTNGESLMNLNDLHWTNLQSESCDVSKEIRKAMASLEWQRERVSRLVSIASDLPALNGDEAKKREVIMVWRAMLKVLDQAGFSERTLEEVA
jgi:hypothetical protein